MANLIKVILLCSFLLTLQRSLGQGFKEKVFEYKSVVDTGYVKAELYLLQDKRFCIIRYTKKANKVTGGTYILARDSLCLIFIPKVVTHGVHGRFRFYLRERKSKLSSVSFRVSSGYPEQIQGILHRGILPIANRVLDSYDQKNRVNSLYESPEWVVLQGKKAKDLKKEWRDEYNKAK